MNKILSSNQKKILEFIRTSLEDSGDCPTIRELMSDLKVKSPRAISHHLDALEKEGYIKRTGESRRNILLTEKDPKNPFSDLVKVPLVGWTAGGEAIYSEENILDWISISSKFIRAYSEDIFLLKVKGDSMSPRIEDGDIIIVKRQYTADSGQTIVALIGSNTTVKKYHPSKDHIMLQPENPAHKPIMVTPDELRVQGVVQGVLKYC